MYLRVQVLALNQSSLSCSRHHPLRFLKPFPQRQMGPVLGGCEGHMQCEAFSTVQDTQAALSKR